MEITAVDASADKSRRKWSFLPPSLTDELVNHHTRLSYAKDALIFTQGAPADVLFYVLNGVVKIYCPIGDGERVLLRLAGPGDLLGNVDFLDSGEHRTQLFEAQAFTRCSLALLTREYLRKSAEMLDRKGLVQLFESLNSAWSSVAHWYAVFLGLSFRDRLEAVFRDLATRFGVKERRGILVLPELSQIDFAEMIQSSRPMVSRLITEMIESKVLERRGRQYVVTERLLAGEIACRGEVPFDACRDDASRSSDYGMIAGNASAISVGSGAVAMLAAGRGSGGKHVLAAPRNR
jgi:CRP/FNR family transcriptional regulator